MKPIVHIRNWELIKNKDPYSQEFKQVLKGETLNHPEHSNGHNVITSPIVEIDIDRRRVETYNTIYILVGSPSSSYMQYLKGNQHSIYLQLRPN